VGARDTAAAQERRESNVRTQEAVSRAMAHFDGLLDPDMRLQPGRGEVISCLCGGKPLKALCVLCVRGELAADAVRLTAYGGSSKCCKGRCEA
jgi:hypothetical protein